MSRPKQQKLKKRADGRYRCAYHGMLFYGYTQEEALEAREQYKRQEAAGEYSRKNPIVQTYADSWVKIAKVGIRKNSLNQDKIHLSHLCRVIGDQYIRDVKPSDIKRVYSTEYKDASRSYISHAKSLFSSLFNSALEDGIIRSNPAKSAAAQPHEGKAGSHRAITPEERQIIETVALDLPASIAARVMLYTGLRPQEIKALSIQDIDFERKIIHVRSFVHVKGSNAYEIDKTGKTKKAIRDVPLFPPTEEALKGRKGYLISNNGKIVTPSVWANEWSTYKNAIERHLNGMQKRWYGRTKEHKQLVSEGNQLPEWKEFTVVPYDLRHSFVTWCRDNGVELRVCVEWMGHRDANMIMKIYDDPSHRSKIEAEKLVKKLFKGSEKGSETENKAELADTTGENKDAHITS